MNTRSAKLTSLAVNDNGVTSIEYALIVGLIALTIIGALGDVGGVLASFFTMLSGELSL